MEGKKKNHSNLQKAVALRYRPAQDSAPVITAVGRGWLAERIIALARENRIPVIEDRSLAEILSGLRPGEAIPVELYEAVAAIYAFIMEVDRRQGQEISRLKVK
ncbi:MAG: hypothetical protein GX044_06320 [Firmicutes bacterium]|nr:hypothetical protein [Bacillota bacterium]